MNEKTNRNSAVQWIVNFDSRMYLSTALMCVTALKPDDLTRRIKEVYS